MLWESAFKPGLAVNALAGEVCTSVSVVRGKSFLDNAYLVEEVERFEERRDADEADLVVPHHSMGSSITAGYDEGVLEHCVIISVLMCMQEDHTDSPSNASLPVLAKNVFLSLEYGICLT